MWIVTQASGEIHVTPLEDLRPHELHSRCWCEPAEDCDQPDVFTHNSLDGREGYESGERALS